MEKSSVPDIYLERWFHKCNLNLSTECGSFSFTFPTYATYVFIEKCFFGGSKSVGLKVEHQILQEWVILSYKNLDGLFRYLFFFFFLKQ